MLSYDNFYYAAIAAGVKGLSLHEQNPSALMHAMMKAKSPDVGLQMLSDKGELRELFPEVEALRGFGGQGKGHKDLWSHTKKVVLQSPPYLKFRWAALFHDVGKVSTFSVATGKISFHGHERVSSKLFAQASRRTRFFATDLYQEVRFLVQNLGKVESYSADWTDSAVRRLVKESEGKIYDLVALAKADVTTAKSEKQQRIHNLLDNLLERVESIQKADEELTLLPKGLGNCLMQKLGIPPSKALGDMMQQLKEAVQNGRLPARAEPEIYVDYALHNLSKKD